MAYARQRPGLTKDLTAYQYVALNNLIYDASAKRYVASPEFAPRHLKLTSLSEPMPTIYVSYGYDQHQIQIDQDTFLRIRAGDPVSVDGQGFLYDDEWWFTDHWSFNSTPGDIRIYLDNGAEFNAQEVGLDEGTASAVPEVKVQQ